MTEVIMSCAEKGALLEVVLSVAIVIRLVLMRITSWKCPRSIDCCKKEAVKR